MSGGFLIRPAYLDDAPVIAEIHERGWQLAYGHFLSPETLAEKSAEKRLAFWQERIADPARIVLVGTDAAGAVMGMVYGGPVLEHDLTGGRIDDFASELYILHCRAEVQGRGLGKLLTAALARRFRDQDARSLLLWAFTDNQFRVFYDRLGGEIVAEGRDEGQADIAYGWRDIDALIAACEGATNTAKTASTA
ncbi:MAG TPA: GNAT family N-acetyltransferase [Terriglobales bacterium]|nr:GNAT family N-acetyltransferase [Terriglobales bacterium]